MPTEMVVTAVHEGGMRMAAGTEDYQVATDYPLAPGEQCAALRPLELLLCSLTSCTGSAVALLLQRMRQPLAGLEVNARATRADEHPQVLTHIALEFVVRGAGSRARGGGTGPQAGREPLPRVGDGQAWY